MVSVSALRRNLIAPAMMAVSAALVACVEPDGDARYTKELIAAEQQARATLDEFFDRLAAPSPLDYDFRVCVRLPSEGALDPIWLDDVRLSADGYVGAVAASSVGEGRLKRGDHVAFRHEDIVDWSYFSGETLHGHYTTRVRLQRMPQEQADILRSILSDDTD
jgi:uncharacterized protein YegJ (DUF2314 family)